MMRLLLLAIIHIQLATLPLSAYAWNFDEHVSIGEHSYKQACIDLLELEWGEREKLLLEKIACRDLASTASLYGQATALAGDHLSNPQDFLRVAGEMKANSFVTYAIEALRNSSHFHPRTRRMWRDHHLASQRQAVRARNRAEFLLIEAAFEEAFYLHAYADHFLHDAFSAGHAAFARSATRPNIAAHFHDQYNEQGRIFSDGLQRTWYAFGDGYLNSHKHGLGKDLLFATARVSVRNFLRAFVTGNFDENEAADVLTRFPSWTAWSIPDKCTIERRGLLQCPYDERIDIFPLAGVHLPAYARKERGWSILLQGQYRDASYTSSYGISAEWLLWSIFDYARLGPRLGILARISDLSVSEAFLQIESSSSIFYSYPNVYSIDLITALGLSWIFPSVDVLDRRAQVTDLFAVRADAGLRMNIDLKYVALQFSATPLVLYEGNVHFGGVLSVGVSSLGSVSGGGMKR